MNENKCSQNFRRGCHKVLNIYISKAASTVDFGVFIQLCFSAFKAYLAPSELLSRSFGAA